MPALPPAAAAIGSLLAFLATPVGNVFVSVALTGASYLINKALTPKIDTTGIDQGIKQTLQSDIYPERLIYGRALVGGRLFFYECKPPYLYFGLEVASHKISDIEKILINGKEVTFDVNGAASSVNFVNGTTPYIYRSIRKGGAGQVIDPILTADFPDLETTFQQQGHACVVFKMYYGSDADDHEKYWGSGAPQCLFLVKGMEAYNPLDATQSATDETTWQWSESPSLCQAHYLTYSKGMRRDWSRIDIDTLKVAAAAENRAVALADGSTEHRYTLNGVVDVNVPSGENLQNMLTANLGKLIWSNGKYKFLSGAERTAVWTLNDHSARGDMEASTARDRAALVNVVRTLFVSSDREYQTTNGPILTNAGYVTSDGEEHEISISLPFTNSQTMTQRIAKATMEKARLGRRITRRESIEAIMLEAGDVVNIEVPHLPVLGGVFELNSFKLDHETFEVEIDAEEYADSILQFDVSEYQPFTIAPVDLAGVN